MRIDGTNGHQITVEYITMRIIFYRFNNFYQLKGTETADKDKNSIFNKM